MSTVINNEVEDENEGDQRSLLLDTNSTQPSVNILYLLLLTCGIGGYVITLTYMFWFHILILNPACKSFGL